MPETSTEQNTARTSIDIARDEAAVWEALTSDEGLAPWMGEGATVEAVPGGALSVADPVGGQARRGTIEVAEPWRRLDFLWWPIDRPIEATRVSIVLMPIESGTRVTVTETAPSARLTAGTARAGAVPTGSVGAMATAPMLRLACWSWRFAALSVACRLVRC